MRGIGLFVQSCLVLGLSTWSLAAEPAVPKQITSIEGITEYELDNGLRILLFPDSSRPTVTVNLTVFVGSRHEGYGEAGMAHLLEHMLFKGTPTHEEIPKLMKQRGANFNGTTWLDRTNYYETLPASGDNLEFAIRLEADRMVNSYIKGEDLESEMTVVRSEFERGENSPGRVLQQRITSAAFEWHNYGQSTIGNRADIERVPVESLRRFYVKHYQPDNAMLVVAGKFDADKALELASKYFGAITRPERVLEHPYTEEPAQDGERNVTLRRVGKVGLAGVLYHIPSGAHPDYAAIDVLERVMNAEPAGHLYKALVETKKAASVSGAAYALHDPGLLLIMAEASPGNDPRDVMESMLEVLETTGERGASEEDVERAKQSLLKQRELAAADSRRIAIQLSEWAAQGDWRLYFLYRDRLEKVTPDDVQRVAAAYLKRNNRTSGLYIPTDEPERIAVPVTPDLVKMIGDYKGRELIAVGEEFDVSPENIEQRTTRSNLPSGIKVAVLPKETRGETVNLRLTLRYGNLDSLRGNVKAGEFLPRLMLRGTKSLDRQQIKDELDKYRSQLGASTGSPGSATFTIKTKRENLVPTLNILRQILREPTFPQEELELLQQSQVAAFEQRLDDPTSKATTHVNRQVNPYDKDDPRYYATIQEEIERTKSVTVDRIRGLYEQQLSGQAGELTIVGDFDPESVLTACAEFLSDWQSDTEFVRIQKRGDVELERSLTEIKTPDKANATFFAGTVLPMRDDHPDYPALVIGNFILGGGAISSRLADRVRQDEGLSYSVGSGLRASAVDERSTFYIFAICNPANMTKLRGVIDEEVDRLRKGGVTAEELEKAKVGYLQRREVSRTDDGSLTQTIATTSLADRTMVFTSEFEQAVRGLTVDAVNAAIRRHIDPKRFCIAAAGDFDKAAAEAEKAAGEDTQAAGETTKSE